jgi:phytoene synthase
VNEPAIDPDAVITAHSRSFSTASRFLPKSIRGDVVKLYAWCRACDDAVDQAESFDEALAQWQILRDDVDRITRGEVVEHLASGLLQGLMQDCGVTRDHAIDLLTGMQIDLQLDRGETAIRTEADLLRYCYHAAGVVGLMMCRVMGVQDRRAASHAKSLGIAMQLTNIARDVCEDAERGRCYLPGGGGPENIAKTLDLADQHYRHAAAGMVYLPRRCRIAILIASALYREIGQEIRRRDCDVLGGRTVVPRLRFAWTAITAACSSLTHLWPTSDRSSNSTSFVSNLVSSTEIAMNASTSDSPSNSTSSASARGNAYFGLSLTAFMATALFLMMYINPKESMYQSLPLVYAGVSLVIAIVTNIASRQIFKATNG